MRRFAVTEANSLNLLIQNLLILYQIFYNVHYKEVLIILS